MSKITISILCLNNLALTQRCLAAVLNHSAGHDIHLIITDNGSTDGTNAHLTNEPALRGKATLITNAQNLGFIQPNNHAFRLACERGADYFICLNNDTAVPPGWLDKLIAPLREHHRAALSGPSGGCSRLLMSFHGTSGPPDEYVEGSCLCIKVAAIQAINSHRGTGTLFSSYLEFAYGEDADLSLRVQEAGYSIHHVDFHLNHVVSATKNSSDDLRARCDAAEARNHAVLRERWKDWLQTRKFAPRVSPSPRLPVSQSPLPIIIQRRAALGDVLLTTPILRAIRAAYPDSPLAVETDCPEVLDGNPLITHCGAHVDRHPDMAGALIVDLNGAYESRPLMHYLAAYEEATRAVLSQLGRVEWKTEMFVISRKSEEQRPRFCVIHAGPTGWPGRNWPIDRFHEVTAALQREGWAITFVGRDEIPVPAGCRNLIGKQTVQELAGLLSNAGLFIGIDSFPMHAAQAVGCPTVGIFGMSSSRYVMTQGSPHIGVDADPSIPCTGGRHREAGKTFINCDPACINSVTVDQVLAAVRQLISPARAPFSGNAALAQQYYS